jgi:hypothetical protein
MTYLSPLCLCELGLQHPSYVSSCFAVYAFHEQHSRRTAPHGEKFVSCITVSHCLVSSDSRTVPVRGLTQQWQTAFDCPVNGQVSELGVALTFVQQFLLHCLYVWGQPYVLCHVSPEVAAPVWQKRCELVGTAALARHNKLCTSVPK